MMNKNISDVDDVSSPVPIFNKWVILVCSVLIFGVAISTPVSLSVMFLDWQESFQVTRAHTAVAHSTCVGILFGGAIIPGYVMNRFGPRLTILFGSIIAAIGLVLSMFAVSIDYLVVTTGVIAGTGFCFLQLPIIPCITMVFTSHKTMVISLCQIAAGLFNIIYPHILRYLVHSYSWRGAFGFVAGITLNMCIPGFIISSFTRPRSLVSIVTAETSDDDSCKDDDEEKDEEEEENTKTEQEKNNLIRNEDTVCHSTISDRDCPEKHNCVVINEKEDDLFDYDKHISSDISYDTSKDFKKSFIMNGNENKIHTHNTSDYSTKISTNNFTATLRTKLTKSKWRFLTDSLYLLLLCHVCFSSAVCFSFAMILMDFAKTNGFEESTGVDFITSVYTASMLARFGVAITDLFPRIPILLIQIAFSIPGTIGLLLLSFISSFEPVICLICLVGLSIGGLVSIYPRSVMEMESVDTKTYPIALGFTCSIEGMMYLLLPVIIGYSVDETGSYSTILVIVGCASMVSTLALTAGFIRAARHRRNGKCVTDSTEDG